MTTEIILRDVEQLAGLSSSDANPPFMVVDMGWGKGTEGAGPWSQDNCRLPDMPGIAVEIRKRGVRPGIWVRPLLTVETLPEEWQSDTPREAGGLVSGTASKAVAQVVPSSR